MGCSLNTSEKLAGEFIRLCTEKSDQKIALAEEGNSGSSREGGPYNNPFEQQDSEFEQFILKWNKIKPPSELVVTEKVFHKFNKSEGKNVYVGNFHKFVLFDFETVFSDIQSIGMIFFRNCVFAKKIALINTRTKETRFTNCLFRQGITLREVICQKKVWFDSVPCVLDKNHCKPELKRGFDEIGKGNEISILDCEMEDFAWNDWRLHNPTIAIDNGKIQNRIDIWFNYKTNEKERPPPENENEELRNFMRMEDEKSRYAHKCIIRNTQTSALTVRGGDSYCNIEINNLSRYANKKENFLQVKIDGCFDNLIVQNVKKANLVDLINIKRIQTKAVLRYIDTEKLFIVNVGREIGYVNIPYKYQKNKNDNLDNKKYINYFELSNIINTQGENVIIKLENVEFSEKVLFNNIILGKNTFEKVLFQKNVEFSSVIFHNYLELHQDNFTNDTHVQFLGCKFDIWNRDIDYKAESIEESFRVLKNQSKKVNYEYGEHLFTALELRTRVIKIKWEWFNINTWSFEKFLGEMGWFVNQFGNLLGRPLLILGILCVIFTILYYSSSLVLHSKCNDIYCSSKWLPSVRYSIDNTLFFTKILSSEKFYRTTNGGYFLGIFQIILSAPLLYLFIIGVKKRFRQK